MEFLLCYYRRRTRAKSFPLSHFILQALASSLHLFGNTCVSFSKKRGGVSDFAVKKRPESVCFQGVFACSGGALSALEISLLHGQDRDLRLRRTDVDLLAPALHRNAYVDCLLSLTHHLKRTFVKEAFTQKMKAPDKLEVVNLKLPSLF